MGSWRHRGTTADVAAAGTTADSAGPAAEPTAATSAGGESLGGEQAGPPGRAAIAFGTLAFAAAGGVLALAVAYRRRSDEFADT